MSSRTSCEIVCTLLAYKSPRKNEQLMKIQWLSDHLSGDDASIPTQWSSNHCFTCIQVPSLIQQQFRSEKPTAVETGPTTLILTNIVCKTTIDAKAGQKFRSLLTESTIHPKQTTQGRDPRRFNIPRQAIVLHLRSILYSVDYCCSCAELATPGAGSNPINNHFMHQIQKEPLQSSKTPVSRCASHEVPNFEYILHFFVGTDDPSLCPSLGMIKNLAVNVLLGTSFFDCHVQDILSSEQDIVLHM